ncbi:MAG: hypothetical protein UV35_C0026G0014 [candidate division WWE3 bacterium GW2011_GWB1_42_6]|uniref:Uncharacterized protein n=1 Tax=candidate division WWE3 bacterium GW2011_GWB1_42_6 TaxID=1619115 RepID=A0A0G1AYM8_UNCKA|nr:MAG: hypothetical protein UV35_C0026G0014 [candidate division WWE3 bacterium GW2011_GWB1_42_6]
MNHKTFDNAVKNNAVVEWFVGNFFAGKGINSGAFSKFDKIPDCIRSYLGEKGHLHGTFVGFDNSGNVFGERRFGWGGIVHIGWIDFNIG